MTRNLLIDAGRVKTNPYFLTWVQGFNLAGFIMVTPYTAPPSYGTWSDTAYNRFCGIAHEAYVDGKPCFVLPVFVNHQPSPYKFDGDKAPNNEKQWVAYFLGNDDLHYAMRFETANLRDEMIQMFGEDLGFLEKELIGHN